MLCDLVDGGCARAERNRSAQLDTFELDHRYSSKDSSTPPPKTWMASMAKNPDVSTAGSNRGTEVRGAVARCDWGGIGLSNGNLPLQAEIPNQTTVLLGLGTERMVL